MDNNKQIRIAHEHCAQRSFEFHLCELRRDMTRGVPVKHLWVRVELLEELVERTGGSVLTERYRVALCEAKKHVALRAERHRACHRKTRLGAVT